MEKSSLRSKPQLRKPLVTKLIDLTSNIKLRQNPSFESTISNPRLKKRSLCAPHSDPPISLHPTNSVPDFGDLNTNRSNFLLNSSRGSLRITLFNSDQIPKTETLPEIRTSRPNFNSEQVPCPKTYNKGKFQGYNFSTLSRNRFLIKKRYVSRYNT
jgi:hypothetical protein